MVNTPLLLPADIADRRHERQATAPGDPADQPRPAHGRLQPHGLAGRHRREQVQRQVGGGGGGPPCVPSCPFNRSMTWGLYRG